MKRKLAVGLLVVVMSLAVGSVGFVYATASSDSGGEVVASCYPGLPSPRLALESIQQLNTGRVYWLAITNWPSFPDELFEPAPHLPPCGQNPNASRTWLRIFDADGKYVYGHCAFSSASDLGSFGFFVPEGSSPPSAVYITLHDRECDAVYTSNIVPIPIAMAIDIKPGSCPNPVGLEEAGVLPVAILGLGDLDVTQIDPATVRLYEKGVLDPVEVAPLRWSLEDAGIPYEILIGKEDSYDCLECYPGKHGVFDGYVDLSLKFETQEVTASLSEISPGDVIVLQLSGKLKEEYGGTDFLGEDTIWIAPR